MSDDPDPSHQPTSGAPNRAHDVLGTNDLDGLIETALRLVRARLGMEVSFVSKLEGDRRTFRYVDAHDGSPIAAGDWGPAAQSYCAYVVDQSLPEFLRDPAQHPVSAALDATHDIPVGTHMSVPIEFSNGDVYGTLCSFDYTVRDDLDESDIEVLHTVSRMIANYVEEAEARHRVDSDRIEQLRRLEVDDGLTILFQPIVDLATGHIMGFEALSRFPTLNTGPAELFAEASRLGIGPEFELKAAAAALRHIPALPGDTYVAINLGPETIVSKECVDLLSGTEPGRIIVEVTEHAIVDDYERLLAANQALKRLGVRLAIDDVGTGYSGLDHMLRTQPDVLKLDGALISNIDTDLRKQAIIASLQTYSARIGTRMIAERVETSQEHQALSVLGVAYGQGYHYAKPAPLDQFVVESLPAA